jgi:hypothetical protein
MKRKKLIIFFILFFIVLIIWTTYDYFFGFGYGLSFTWKEYFEDLPWRIIGCFICSFYGMFEYGDDFINLWEKRKKKNKDNILLNE